MTKAEERACQYTGYSKDKRYRDYLNGYSQAIEDTCEWLKSYRQDTPDGTGYIAGIVNDKTIEDFKNYMKGKWL